MLQDVPDTHTHTVQELCELGVVSGADLTVEAALTKLSYLLGQEELSVHKVRTVLDPHSQKLSVFYRNNS